MKFMATWKIAPQHINEAVGEFLRTGAPAPEGVNMLGRWHVVGTGRGFVLCEADDLGPVATHLSQWNHLLELEIFPVMEDEEAGAAMAAGKGIAL